MSALAAGSGSLPAAASAEMRGTALEAGGRTPVVGAVVMLFSQERDGTHYLTSSDPQGRFLFHSLDRGTYDLEVSLPGYRTKHKTNLQVRPPFRSIIEVLLEPGAEPEESPRAQQAPAVSGNVQDPGEVDGAKLTLTLTGPTHEPVPEGLAALVPLSFEGERGYGRSDSQGRITFTTRRPGRYRLVASAPGYLTVRSERIELARGSASRVIVILTPYPLDYAGNLEDLLPPEEPLLPRRLEIDIPRAVQPGRTP